jgi:hypothetical protein
LLKNENHYRVKENEKKSQAKEVGEQLIVDIAHYETHPDCGFSVS